MPLQGLYPGAQPVLGYNYGAKQYGPCPGRIRFVTVMALAFASAVWLVLMLFPGQLIRLFNGEEELLEVGIVSLRIHLCCLFLWPFSMRGRIFLSAWERQSRQCSFPYSAR